MRKEKKLTKSEKQWVKDREKEKKEMERRYALACLSWSNKHG